MTEIADRQYPTSGEAKSFARDKSGAAAIEFGILALPFFLIVFAIIETSLVFMAETSMDNAVHRVGRSVRVGDFAPSSEGELRQHICSETVGLFACEKFKVSLIAYGSYADIPTAPPLTDGKFDNAAFGIDSLEPELVMVLQATYDWPLYTDMMRKLLSNTSDGTHLIIGQSIFKTEPFL